MSEITETPFSLESALKSTQPTAGADVGRGLRLAPGELQPVVAIGKLNQECVARAFRPVVLFQASVAECVPSHPGQHTGHVGLCAPSSIHNPAESRTAHPIHQIDGRQKRITPGTNPHSLRLLSAAWLNARSHHPGGVKTTLLPHLHSPPGRCELYHSHTILG